MPPIESMAMYAGKIPAWLWNVFIIKIFQHFCLCCKKPYKSSLMEQCNSIGAESPIKSFRQHLVILIKYPNLHLHSFGYSCKGIFINLTHILNNSAIIKGCHLFAKCDTMLFQPLRLIRWHKYMSGKISLFVDFGRQGNNRITVLCLFAILLLTTTTGRILPWMLPWYCTPKSTYNIGLIKYQYLVHRKTCCTSLELAIMLYCNSKHFRNFCLVNIHVSSCFS